MGNGVDARFGLGASVSELLPRSLGDVPDNAWQTALFDGNQEAQEVAAALFQVHLDAVESGPQQHLSRVNSAVAAWPGTRRFVVSFALCEREARLAAQVG